MFIISETIKKGWNEAKSNLSLYIPVLLIFLVVIILFSFILKRLGVIGQIIMIIIESWLSIGIIIIALKRARDEEASISDLFKGHPYLLNYILSSLIYAIIVIVGIVLLIIPGAIWSLKYMFYPYLIIDKNLSATDALKESGNITKGYKWDLLAFTLVTNIIILLGILALGIGFFVAYPTVLIAEAILYLKLAENS